MIEMLCVVIGAVGAYLFNKLWHLDCWHDCAIRNDERDQIAEELKDSGAGDIGDEIALTRCVCHW